MITQKRHKILIMIFAITCCSALSSCEDKVDLPSQPIDSFTQVYMPQVVNGPVVATLKIKDIVQTATYGAIYGGQGLPQTDIAVSFSVNSEAIASYNAANSTNYVALPATSYVLSATDAVIPKGETSTKPLSITFKTVGPGAMEAMKTYILPISVSSPSVKINEALRTAYYIVKAQPDLADYPNYDRSVMSVVEFSSQEANGEGPANGKAIFAFDGNTDTYWHTQWQGASPGPPHFVVLDLGSEKLLHGIQFQGRQNDGGGKPNNMNVQVSFDKVTWRDAGSFNLQNTRNLQPIFLPNGFQSARYVKIVVNSSYGGNYSILSEIYPF
jgi:hypothetical protein